MAAWKFYAAERERWPSLNAINCSPEWAERAIKKLARHFKVRPISVRFQRAGSTWSHGGWGGIDLSPEANWLTVIHEFCHCWDTDRRGREFGHDKKMARLVDRACTYVTRKGWADLDLAEQFEAFCKKEEAATPPALLIEHGFRGTLEKETDAVEKAEAWLGLTHVPAPPAPDLEFERSISRAARGMDRAEKIAHKEKQLARLERKIKSLTTRAKKVRRSLNALKRHAL